MSRGHSCSVRCVWPTPIATLEVDNRLSWFLGRLDQTYGDRAYDVHLRRDDLSVARSYRQRYGI
ncbi:hypothetical protein [Thermosynechococcus sp. PKX82]|uniref:hypothetical protein n=1 Tax=Thermosynechococcus sp. PKX82 TaxID=3074086 RepID=UPI002872D7E2|nr:hypothetical protein [Thermosynechococcus sp. PKX82]WNC29392.1 hypothetical protein RHH53_10050 [Thermosynechococcus sp. PKX82]